MRKWPTYGLKTEYTYWDINQIRIRCLARVRRRLGSNQIRNCCLHIHFSYTNLNFMSHLISLSTKSLEYGLWFVLYSFPLFACLVVFEISTLFFIYIYTIIF